MGNSHMTPYEQAKWQYHLRMEERARLKSQLDWSLALNFVLLVAFVTTLLIGGCATVGGLGTEYTKPRQDEAMRIAWHDVYSRIDEPPRVRWVEGDDLDCIDPNSERPGFGVVIVTGKVCREGVTESPWVVFVAWRDGDRFSDTVFCHEVLHVAQARELRPDGLHLGDAWKPGGLVDDCNHALVGAGL